MEFILFLMLAVIIVLLYSMKNSSEHRLNSLQERIDKLTMKIDKLNRPLSQDTTIPPVVTTPTILKKEETPKTVTGPPVESPKETIIKYPQVITPVTPPRPKSVKEPKPGFFERNPDLEKFIGENLANKIGIAVLVLGIGFFVKYAIDKNWINVYGRVFIGILCGGGLLSLAHYLRKNFAAFSSVLVGGGIAVLYLTITIAFQEYKIIGQVPAFLIMVAITVFTILLSLAYNRIELAILAILGGFGSPFMVSTGEGNYIVLFSYILLLDVGMVVLAFFKRWNLVNIVAYAFTILLVGSWLGIKFDHSDPTMLRGGMVFTTLFYFVFFAMNVVNNIRQRTKFNPLEISMLLSNTFLYYSAGMYILNSEHGDVFKGLFTACIGVFNFAFAYFLYKNTKVDRTLVFLLIGLVLTFISLAAPIQLEGNYITLFWAAECVLLLWLSQQSGIRLMKIASVIVMALMMISLIMDWTIIYQLDEENILRIIFNKGFVTSLVSIASMLLFIHFLKKESDEYAIRAKQARNILMLVSIIFGYTAGWLELDYHLNIYVADYASRSIVLGTFTMMYVLALIAAHDRFLKVDVIRRASPLAGIIVAIAYLLFYHPLTITARNGYVTTGEGTVGLGFHYLLVILVLVIAAWSVNRFRSLKDFNERSFNAYSWFFVFFFVFVASAELDHTLVLTLYQGEDSLARIIRQNHKIGFPILWGIASFILIAVGLKKRLKHLRIISLTLFLITLLKLFLIDIRGISEGGKIAAFISLGVLLLVVSFMYQRLKRLLLNDETASQTENSAES